MFTTCPNNVTANTDAGVATSVVDWTVEVVDYSGFVTVTSTSSPNDTFSIGSTEVSYTAIDPSGNTAQCNFTVIVSGMEMKKTICFICELFP